MYKGGEKNLAMMRNFYCAWLLGPWLCIHLNGHWSSDLNLYMMPLSQPLCTRKPYLEQDYPQAVHTPHKNPNNMRSRSKKNSLLSYLQPSKMQYSCEANYFQHLVMHGLRLESVRDIILILPQVNPSHVAPDVGNKDTFSVLQWKELKDKGHDIV